MACVRGRSREELVSELKVLLMVRQRLLEIEAADDVNVREFIQHDYEEAHGGGGFAGDDDEPATGAPANNAADDPAAVPADYDDFYPLSELSDDDFYPLTHQYEQAYYGYLGEPTIHLQRPYDNDGDDEDDDDEVLEDARSRCVVPRIIENNPAIMITGGGIASDDDDDPAPVTAHANNAADAAVPDDDDYYPLGELSDDDEWDQPTHPYQHVYYDHLGEPIQLRRSYDDDDEDEDEALEDAILARRLYVPRIIEDTAAITATTTGDDDHARGGGGFGAVPASAAAIAELKKLRYDGSSSRSGCDSSCVICLRDYKKKGTRLAVMPCEYRHRFHAKCLRKWLSRSHLCPLCRYALPTDEDQRVHDPLRVLR